MAALPSNMTQNLLTDNTQINEFYEPYGNYPGNRVPINRTILAIKIQIGTYDLPTVLTSFWSIKSFCLGSKTNSAALYTTWLVKLGSSSVAIKYRFATISSVKSFWLSKSFRQDCFSQHKWLCPGESMTLRPVKLETPKYCFLLFSRKPKSTWKLTLLTLNVKKRSQTNGLENVTFK